MKIGGIQKVSLIDYPGQLSTTVFSQGCNFRCPYCHNPELVNPDLYSECMPENEILLFLKKRQGVLDALTITGGEPTIQLGLIPFVKKIKKLKYLVKIDTNGSMPEVLYELVSKKLIDYIAMDVKGPLQRYNDITGSQIDEGKIIRSIDIIMSSGIPYEFRTTVLKSQLKVKDLLEIGGLIKHARIYVLQMFNAAKTLNRNYMKETTYTHQEMESIRRIMSKNIGSIMIR